MITPLSIPNADARVLKRTKSVCPTCRRVLFATILEQGGRVYMEKRCPEHGDATVLLARDARFYHLSVGADDGCGADCGCAPTPTTVQSSSPFETLSTCIALIEIVESCNLTCPTCYAASPLGVDDDITCASFDDIARRIGGVIERKGYIDILQLSGGEPTIHPEFERILDWCLDQSAIGYILINTNAVRIARDDDFRARLGARRQNGARFELYVQFDGVQEAGQHALRGADLRRIREAAIDHAGALGVPSTLAMTVTPTTIPHLGDALRFGLERSHVRGMTFQPVFTSGRINDAGLPMAPPEPLAVGDVIHALVDQSGELLAFDDFTPLPCGDPNCHTIGYLLRTEAGVHGLSRFLNLADHQDFLRDRVDYRLDDLSQCGCDNEPLGELLKQFELGPDAPFRLFIKPFMDAWTFDQHRIDRCCTHVVRKDGSLDSFCRYYLNGGAAADPG